MLEGPLLLRRRLKREFCIAPDHELQHRTTVSHVGTEREGRIKQHGNSRICSVSGSGTYRPRGYTQEFGVLGAWGSLGISRGIFHLSMTPSFAPLYDRNGIFMTAS